MWLRLLSRRKVARRPLPRRLKHQNQLIKRRANLSNLLQMGREMKQWSKKQKHLEMRIPKEKKLEPLRWTLLRMKTKAKKIFL